MIGPNDVAGDSRGNLWAYLGSALSGFLAAVATFRERFRAMEKDRDGDVAIAKERRASDSATVQRELGLIREQVQQQIDRLERRASQDAEERKEYRREMTRRQLVMLELVGDVAGKAGVTSRALDLLPRLLSED